LIIEEAWSSAYADAHVGLLRMTGVRNPENDPALDVLLDETSARLRARWAGSSRADLVAAPVMALYGAYYRRFDKTYHILLQLESVALKGKPLRSHGALVSAMFAAELESGLLTAGHDAAHLVGDLTLGVVASGDRYLGIGGREIQAALGDMCIRDASGIISSIVYGHDDRTRLRESSNAAVFTTYAPSGIGPEAVARHLEALAAGVRVVAPAATIESLEVLPHGS
jgi:DNA/RNA-binding domain of Phe-tRNA-synthetase-like protein